MPPYKTENYSTVAPYHIVSDGAGTIKFREYSTADCIE